MSWSARLECPVKVPGGSPLVTLSDARDYILELPETKQREEFTQHVVNAMLMAAEGRGPVFTAHVGIVTLIHGPAKIGEPTTGKKEPRWRKTKHA